MNKKKEQEEEGIRKNHGFVSRTTILFFRSVLACFSLCLLGVVVATDEPTHHLVPRLLLELAERIKLIIQFAQRHQQMKDLLPLYRSFLHKVILPIVLEENIWRRIFFCCYKVSYIKRYSGYFAGHSFLRSYYFLNANLSKTMQTWRNKDFARPGNNSEKQQQGISWGEGSSVVVAVCSRQHKENPLRHFCPLHDPSSSSSSSYSVLFARYIISLSLWPEALLLVFPHRITHRHKSLSGIKG